MVNPDILESSTSPSSLKMADDFKGFNWDKKMEYEKSAVRCKVEHPFLIVKKQMGYSKAIYRGIAKKHASILYVVCQCKSNHV